MLLAGLYLLGKGVPRDIGEAYYWLLRAGAPRPELKAVASLLKPETIRTIELRLALTQESFPGHRAAGPALLANKREVEDYANEQTADYVM